MEQDDGTSDRFVEILDRSARPLHAAQHIVVDPLLHDTKFQAKWRSAAAAHHASTDDALRAQNPASHRFVPPLHIARLRSVTKTPHATATAKATYRRVYDEWSGYLETSRLLPACLVLESEEAAHEIPRETSINQLSHAALDAQEETMLRRSLSKVTLRQRIDSNLRRSASATAVSDTKERSAESRRVATQGEAMNAPIYLAIST
ncbi:hypothetical protein PINS_up001378 [Pythium insidiosum]|nr:hypothetical protein PINS_up001378 [Pythium insidiosum]